MAFSFSTKTTLDGTCKHLIKIILFESVTFLKIGIIYYIKLLRHQFAEAVNELWYLQCICIYYIHDCKSVFLYTCTCTYRFEATCTCMYMIVNQSSYIHVHVI